MHTFLGWGGSDTKQGRWDAFQSLLLCPQRRKRKVLAVNLQDGGQAFDDPVEKSVPRVLLEWLQ